MPTPPTGLARGSSAASSGGASAQAVAAAPKPAAPTKAKCPRCSMENALHMRFCNNCGYQLKAEQQQVIAGPPPAVAAAPAPVASEGKKGTVCWRCYGVGDPGAEFCKFCGARYADAPNAAPAVQSSQPSHPVATQQARPQSSRPPSSRPPESSRPPPPVAPTPAPAPMAAARPAPPIEDRPAPASDPNARAILISILKDGTDGRRYPITDDQTDIGREEGHIVLADDPYLSPRHARLVLRSDKTILRDLDSLNGIYVRIREPVDIGEGDMLLLGQQVLRFEILAEAELPLGPGMQQGVMVFGTPEVQRIARLVQYTTEGVGRDVHYLYRDETVIGREQGDLVFTDDPFMSRRHAAITVDRASRRFVLRDLGSSNGTAVRFRGERVLKAGDQFRVGRHLFRFEAGAGGGQKAR
jgi:pSer/pThr/pTyr-binding forkhead associated (FHA) protein